MGNHPLDLMGGYDPTFNAIQIPWLYNNIEANIDAAEKFKKEVYEPVLVNKFNQMPVAMWTYGSIEIISTKEIKTLEDWDGKLVGATSPVVADISEALGASSVSIPWPDLYPSLEKGVIDIAFNGMTPTLSMSFYEVCDYIIPSYPCASIATNTINLDVWNDMPLDIQQILLEENEACVQRENEFNRNGQIDIPNGLIEKGMDVYRLPAAERDRWKAAAQPVIDEIVAMGPEIERIVAIAEEANKMHPYKY
jgi:TRAP-type C4-dicarboxylate transport system substrate-binding protein